MTWPGQAALLLLGVALVAGDALEDDIAFFQHGILAAGGVGSSAVQAGDPAAEELAGIDLPDGIDLPPGVEEEAAKASPPMAVPKPETATAKPSQADEDFEPTVPVPSYAAGERAELLSTDAASFGSWIPCVVQGASGTPGTYEVSLPFLRQPQTFHGVPGKYLRKDKPDAQAQKLADEADAFIATIKKKYAAAPTPRPAAVKKVPPPTAPVRSGKEEIFMKMRDKMLQEMKKPQTTQAPLTPLQELTRWLGRHAEHHNLSLKTLRKLHAMGSRPVVGLVSNNTQEEPWGQNLTFEEQLLLDPVVNGTYQIPSTGQTFSIHNLSCQLLLAGIPDRKGNKLLGQLFNRGEWFVANLTNQGHEPAGSIRFKRGAHPGKAVISWSGTSAQREFGQTGWGGNVPARRVNRTDDRFDGKCDFPAFGCHCTAAGRLQGPEMFFGDAGDDVEIFAPDGSGWYSGVLLDRNASTFEYTVFVPSGESGSRVYEGITLDWLRKVQSPPAAQESPLVDFHSQQGEKGVRGESKMAMQSGAKTWSLALTSLAAVLATCFH